MGRGIGFIPGAIRTIHIDYMEDFDYAKEWLMEREREDYLEELKDFKTISSKKAYVKHNPLREPSENEVWEYVGEQSNENADDILSNIGYIKVCGLINAFGKQDYRSEWTAAYHEEGQLLAENDDLYLVGIYSTDNDVGVGVVPKHDLDDFEQEFEDEHGDKEFWYQARGLDWDERVKKMAQINYDRYLARVEKQEKLIIAEINNHYPFTYRANAWCMTSEIKVGTLKSA
jgi:hypothetical protein